MNVSLEHTTVLVPMNYALIAVDGFTVLAKTVSIETELPHNAKVHRM